MGVDDRRKTTGKGMPMWLKVGLITAASLVAIVCALVVAAVVLFMMPTNDIDNANPATRKEMLSIVLKVGDLQPPPPGAVLRTVKTEGNMFTRSFRVEFSASPASVKRWLAASKGTQKCTPVMDGGRREYILKPREGYSFATVSVDPAFSVVRIYVSWS